MQEKNCGSFVKNPGVDDIEKTHLSSEALLRLCPDCKDHNVSIDTHANKRTCTCGWWSFLPTR